MFREFRLRLEDPLSGRSKYQLEIIGNVTDFAGNTMQRTNYEFGLTEPVTRGDILFNELLFNPLPGDPDYIELYNCSEKTIDASRLMLVSVNDGTGDTSQIYSISDERRCILPGSYFAITKEREKILGQVSIFRPGTSVRKQNMPSMSDDKGHLILLNRELDRIDEVIYSEKMHFSLLSGFEGKSLEKAGPGLNSLETFNWHTAAESAFWGTPGAPNSSFTEVPPTSDKVVFSSTKITPDNDGFEDFLVIGLNLLGNGNVVSATVFDERGGPVKKITSNLLAGSETTLIWDGTADDGSMVVSGIYIVLITLYDDTGKTGKWKKVCAVIRN